MIGKLVFEDKTQFEGESFGTQKSVAGEVVFTTGMVGYPESLTDPSYLGQILVLTYPIVGNYGVPDPKFFESNGIKVSGLIVSNYIDTPSHFQSKMTLSQWLKKENIPALEIKDTRFLAQKIRKQGAMLGKIIIDKEVPFYDPNIENIVAQVSTKKIIEEGSGRKTVVLLDCGVKRSIKKEILKRNVRLITVPWNYDVFKKNLKFDAMIVSNGPGEPKMLKETVAIAKKALENKIPFFGICMGNHILGLASGGDTYKLKFGHRSQNQPCLMNGSSRCYITVQNHGFAVRDIQKGFKPWFTNANDGTNEGIIHEKLPFMSVQFHPEANPGPSDTEWI
ncbi:MAG: glutamine-hydrolyzing carbamoyl-phosphate synthase small subunit, partial [Candidatus Levybacteria bacterium]|nr:glutamine-hydrolyzing carbamoyl-phosphate synthase small subunit [Candidatus Levybacteria bacterium]